MIAATSSGSGKTTVTLALLAALKSLGKQVISFKCGPDYIDPMFHKKVTGIDSRNLDVFLMGEEGVRQSIVQHGTDVDIAVLEGVMGLYDGLDNSSYASSNQVSLLTGTPTILVVDVKGAARSVCATIKGFLDFDDNNIKGVILNNCALALYDTYKQMIESELPLKVVGCLPYIPQAHLESRHLGLITADEVANIKEKVALLGQTAKDTMDLDRLLYMAAGAPSLTYPGDYVATAQEGYAVANGKNVPVRIAVANDEAFSFWYEDNHDLLRSLGAELCPFSPLHDRVLPDDVDGLILWGGYPELYADALARNATMKQSIKDAVDRGLPTYAECGGFMYLQQELTDLEDIRHRMVGVLHGGSHMTPRLQDFGYFRITARQDNLLCKTGQSIPAHFFHHSTSERQGACFTAQKAQGKSFDCIVCQGNVFAGYQHLHFWGNPGFARSFINACQAYREKGMLNGIHIGSS